MAEPNDEQLERLLAVRRFAALSEPTSTEFSVDFLRSTFFNPSKVNTTPKKDRLHGEVLSAQTKPDVLAREVFKALGIEVDPGAQKYLEQQARELTVQAQRGNQRTVQQVVATNVPRNAIVRRGFEDLQTYLDERFGIMYDHLTLAASTYGHFVVAQAVMDNEAGLEMIDLRDSQQNRVS